MERFMNLGVLLSAVIVTLLAVLVYSMLSFYIRSVSSDVQRTTNTQFMTKEKRRAKHLQTIRDNVAPFVKYDFRLKFMEDGYRTKLQNLDYPQEFEELLWVQYKLLFFGFILGLLGLIVSPVVSLLIWIAVVPVSGHPFNKVDKLLSRRKRIIVKEFPRFYNAMFFRYNRDVGTPLAVAVEQYMLGCTSDTMKKELDKLVFKINTYGDIRALSLWKDTLRIPQLVQFSDIMGARLNDRPGSVDLLIGYKRELETIIKANKRSILRKELGHADALAVLFYIDLALLAVLMLLGSMSAFVM